MNAHDVADPSKAGPTRVAVAKGQAEVEVHFDPELVRECEQLIEDLGFSLGPRARVRVVAKAVEFFEATLDAKYTGEEWQRIGVKRELLRVLNAWWAEKLRHERERGSPGEASALMKLVALELLIPKRARQALSTERLCLDIGTWNLRPRLASESRRYRHLHLLVEVLRAQETRIHLNGRGAEPAAALRRAFQQAALGARTS